MDEWIHRFCTELGNDFFCEVDKDFIMDFSNLLGLEEMIEQFEEALDIILDQSDDKSWVRNISNAPSNGSVRCAFDKSLSKTSEKLYGLIHARFISTDRGCKKMLYKYLQGDFGHCPRFLCNNANVLPIGMSDKPGEETVKVFCPRCNEVYFPRLLKHTYIDGAAFGKSFPHMFFMVFPEYRPGKSTEKYVPRLHGFKIHPSAYTLPLQAKRSQVNAYTVRLNGGSVRLNGGSLKKVSESLL